MSGASAGITLWRIGADTPGYEADDLSGKDAELSGGRWNRAGTPMVVASTTRSLACLETVVHLTGDPLPLNRFLVQITVPAPLWSSASALDPAALVAWDAEPAGKAPLDWGAAWAKGRRTLLARVPSIIVPEEWNVLINPAHPDVDKLRAKKVRKWLYDSRLVS